MGNLKVIYKYWFVKSIWVMFCKDWCGNWVSGLLGFGESFG